MRLKARFQTQKAELLRRGRAATPGALDRADLDQLPPPVKRYLEVTHGLPGQRTLAAVLEQKGGIRTAPGRPWMPFTSEQVYSMEPPGFVWLARARVAPRVWMAAKDSFIDGAGNMHIRLLDLVTIADARGPELDQGAGLRFWGEVMAFPDMVLSPRLRWDPVDRDRARFTVLDSEPAISAVLEFDPQGLPAATHADRYRDIGGRRVLTPWSGHTRDWRAIDGRLFPVAWESVWHLENGDFPAVKMDILRVHRYGTT